MMSIKTATVSVVIGAAEIENRIVIGSIFKKYGQAQYAGIGLSRFDRTGNGAG